MTTKIILIAKDIETGTAIVDFALGNGAKLELYESVEAPPLKKVSLKSKKPTATSKMAGKLYWSAHLNTMPNPFRTGSTRAKAFPIIVKQFSPSSSFDKGTTRKFLILKGFETRSIPAIIKGFIKEGMLVE